MDNCGQELEVERTSNSELSENIQAKNDEIEQ